jgi:hypothetical protein
VQVRGASKKSLTQGVEPEGSLLVWAPYGRYQLTARTDERQGSLQVQVPGPNGEREQEIELQVK